MKHGDHVTVGGIPATIDTRINTSGYDKFYEHIFVKIAGLTHATGWMPTVLVQKVGEPETIHSMLKRARMLTDTARERLRPFVNAIGDYLSKPKDTLLGVHWLCEGYSIKCYRGTGAGIRLQHDSICTWDVEDAIHFTIEIEYFNEDNDGETDSGWYNPLRKSIEVRAPLSLAEHFTKKGFEAWVESEESRLTDEHITKAREALTKAKKLQRA